MNRFRLGQKRGDVLLVGQEGLRGGAEEEVIAVEQLESIA
jgi:hypothetical protein